MADDVNDHSQQLEPQQAEQEQHNAQRQRPQAIPAELPRQAKQAPHQFTGGIPALVMLPGRRFGHNQSDKMPSALRPIQRKPLKETVAGVNHQSTPNPQPTTHMLSLIPTMGNCIVGCAKRPLFPARATTSPRSPPRVASG